jgi:hypothetical protein
MEFKTFIHTLLEKFRSNPNTSSLSLADLADEFGYSIDNIKDFLEIIKLNFELYQSLNRKEPEKKELSTSKYKIKMAIKQLQTLSDFFYISGKFPIKSFDKYHEFAKLMGEFPMLFQKQSNGYSTTELGTSIAQQILAFKRLNNFPKSFRIQEYEIQIQ